MSKYFAAKELLEFAVPEYSLFNGKIDFPNEYASTAAIGAQGLYEYGNNQFKALADCCRNILEFTIRKQCDHVCLIKSPLGNVVPVQVLERLMVNQGMSVNIVSLSLPRNDRTTFGLTYKEVISTNVESIVGNNNLVLYLDDVITGTRFRKIARTLKAEVERKQGTVIPCALVFEPHITPNFSWKTDYNRNRAIIKERSEAVKEQHGYLPWFEMPSLPKIKIDDGLPVVYESPVIWGEQPMVAGMKKVNFVFNIIEQFEAILEDIIVNEYKSRESLLSLWSKDSSGVTYIVPDSMLLSVFMRIRDNIDWFEIRNNAKNKFEDDYIGGIDQLEIEQVKERWDWICDEIKKQIEGKLDSQNSNILIRALLDLFSVMQRHFPEARDASYCAYYLRYNKSIENLNTTLVDLILRGS